MLLSHIILAVSFTFAPLVLGLPARLPGIDGIAEPGTLLGRHYLIQDRRQDVLPTISPGATDLRDHTTNSPRRLVPFAKYLADRSDDPWMRVRERRADEANSNVNYLSNVGTYAPPRPFAPPSPGPPPTPTFAVHPLPSSTPPPVVNAPSGVAKSSGSEAGSLAGKDSKRKHASKVSKEKGKNKMRKAKKVATIGTGQGAV